MGEAVTSGPRTLYACSQCGCTDVEYTAWVDANTGDILSAGNDGPRDVWWCRRCEGEFRDPADVTEPDPYVGPAR